MPTIEETYTQVTQQQQSVPMGEIEETYESVAPIAESAGTAGGIGETAIRGAGNALFFGAGDEFRAGVAALTATPFVDDRTTGELYDEALKAERLKSKTLQELNPATSLASEVGGAMLGGGYIAKGLAKTLPANVTNFLTNFGTKKGKAIKAASDLLRGSAVGGTSAGLYGFGEGEGGFLERLENAKEVGTFGAMLGGPLGALSPTLVKGGSKAVELASRAPLANLAVRAYDKGRQALGKEPREGAKISGYNRAAEYLQEIVENPDEVAKRLESQSLKGMTTAQAVDDPALIALQKNLELNNPELARRIETASTEIRKHQTKQLEKLTEAGDTQTTRDVLQGRLAAISDNIEGKLSIAADNAEVAIAKLGTNATEESASKIARQEIDNAYQAVKAEEDRLWQVIPREVKVSWGNAKKAYSDVIKTKANRNILPEYVTKNLNKSGGWKNPEQPVRELHTMSSRLKSDARAAMASGQSTNAKIYRDLAKALDEDIANPSTPMTEGVAEAYRTAVAYSAKKNQTFNQGAVGKILGTLKTGEGKVANELTLRSTIGTGKAKGGVAFDELLEAADTPELRDSVKDYLLVDMQKRLVNNGEVSLRKTENYLIENQALLSKFPDLVEGVKEAAKKSFSKKIVEARVKSLPTNERISVAGQFLNFPVDKEFGKILASKNPLKYTDDLLKQIRKDKSGKALEGLQSSVIKNLVDNVQTSGREVTGDIITSGDKLLDMVLGRGGLANKKTSVAIKKILTPAQINNLKALGNEMRKLDPNRTIQSLEELAQKNPSALTDLFVKVTGARIGAELVPGAGAIQSAAIGSGFMSKLTRNLAQDQAKELLEEALYDPKLMKALLTNKRSSKATKKNAEEVLGNWYKEFTLGQNLAIMEKYILEEEE